MENIYNLLNMNSEVLANFALQGREIENNLETERILKRVTRRLKDIEDRMVYDGRKPDFSVKSVNEVIEKVKRSENNRGEEWSIKELRIVSYHLGRFQSVNSTFEHAVNILENNWKDLFFNGIVFFLMNSWNICSENQREKIYRMLKFHINNYNGGIKRYNQLKDNIDFFDYSGPKRLATLLRTKNLILDDAPMLIGYKSSALSLPYFSNVIVDYVRKKALNNYDFLEELFATKHKLDRTKKLIFAYMIEDADNKADVLLQSNVSRVARRVLGDINSTTIWAPFTGATSEECALLKKAKDLVTAWYARKSVEAFFDICVQDPRRQKCWLEYVQNVSDFRIVGSTSTRTKLLSDSTVAPLLRNCFIETNSRVSTTAALVLFIRDKVFVEFSDVGSLYIYNASNKIVRSIKSKKYLDSTSELKDTSMGIAVDLVSSWSYNYEEEGKLTHRGEWEDRFRRWMRNKLGINPGQKLKYEDSYVKSLHTSKEDIENRTMSSWEENSNSHMIETNRVQHSLFDNDDIFTSIETKTPYPGTRMKSEVFGLQSSLILNNVCRIIADKSFIYVQINRSGRTYFLCENPIKTIEKCSLWVSSLFGDRMYGIKLVCQGKTVEDHILKNLGRLYTKEDDIVFAPTNGNIVVIHTQ